MKNSSDSNGNRTRDLPTCSAVPQPTAPPRTPYINEMYKSLVMLRIESTPLLNFRSLTAGVSPFG
jgi:hypothetical protein